LGRAASVAKAGIRVHCRGVRRRPLLDRARKVCEVRNAKTALRRFLRPGAYPFLSDKSAGRFRVCDHEVSAASTADSTHSVWLPSPELRSDSELEGVELHVYLEFTGGVFPFAHCNRDSVAQM